jgi:hypothetical protein
MDALQALSRAEVAVAEEKDFGKKFEMVNIEKNRIAELVSHEFEVLKAAGLR